MRGIGSLLERFAKLVPPDDTLRSAVVSLAAEKGVPLEKKEVTVRNNVVYINGDAATKSELFIFKRVILAQLLDLFGAKAPKDIR